MTETHSSVLQLATRYFESIGTTQRDIPSFYFCDNEKDANECAALVISGDKRATASCLWSYQINKEDLPKKQDIYIVTDWAGLAVCVIEVEKIEITPFYKITREFAETEGEGDKSLEYWRKVHWDYYHRELEGSNYRPSEDMLIVCEYFKLVYK